MKDTINSQVKELKKFLRHAPQLHDWNEWLTSTGLRGRNENFTLKMYLNDNDKDNPDKNDTKTTVLKAYEDIKKRYFEASRFNAWSI